MAGGVVGLALVGQVQRWQTDLAQAQATRAQAEALAAAARSQAEIAAGLADTPRSQAALPIVVAVLAFLTICVVVGVMLGLALRAMGRAQVVERERPAVVVLLGPGEGWELPAGWPGMAEGETRAEYWRRVEREVRVLR